MKFTIRVIISFTCALVMACIIDVRPGNPPSIYTVASSLPYALTAPTVIMPMAAYSEEYRSRALEESALKGEEYDPNFNKGTGIGYFWGAILSLSFYVPFFYLGYRQQQKMNDGSGESITANDENSHTPESY